MIFAWRSANWRPRLPNSDLPRGLAVNSCQLPSQKCDFFRIKQLAVDSFGETIPVKIHFNFTLQLQLFSRNGSRFSVTYTSLCRIFFLIYLSNKAFTVTLTAWKWPLVSYLSFWHHMWLFSDLSSVPTTDINHVRLCCFLLAAQACCRDYVCCSLTL